MIVAATGHRPNALGALRPYSGQVLHALGLIAQEALEELGAGSIRAVISGMALGWDTAVAAAALERRVPLVAALPFRHQDAVWSERDKRRWRELCQQAEAVHIISKGGYAAWKMMARNKWMVDRADVVLALWDGRADGGTAHTVRYAGLCRVRVVNVWDKWEVRRDTINARATGRSIP